MVIFSHRGIGFGKQENSVEAISCAVKKGFSVEVDLRLQDNSVVLSHDSGENIKDTAEFNELLKLIKENPRVFFALHLKEDSPGLFQKVGDSMPPFKNCLLFITDFKQDNFILDMFKRIGKEQIALYINDKDINLNLAKKVDYFWLDETKGKIYNSIDYFLHFGKKVICCSPELYSWQAKSSLEYFNEIIIKNINMIFGICTDFTSREF